MITVLGLFIVVTFSFTKYSREKGAIWLQHLFAIKKKTKNIVILTNSKWGLDISIPDISTPDM